MGTTEDRTDSISRSDFSSDDSCTSSDLIIARGSERPEYEMLVRSIGVASLSLLFLRVATTLVDHFLHLIVETARLSS